MTLSPTGWAYEIVSGGGERVDGFVLYDVRFWTSPERQRDGLGEHVIDGVRCDLANNFKMQIRENHQRIKTSPPTPQEPEGFMLHASGVPVPMRVLGNEQELSDFLKANGNPARSGYPPFIFPTYAGVDEELSNEWQHETYTLPLLLQAEANTERYIDVAIAGRASPQHAKFEDDVRGTTLNLQVGAGADDGTASDDSGIGSVFSSGSSLASVGHNFSDGDDIVNSWFRFTGVSGLSGRTIDTATAQIFGFTTFPGPGSPITKLLADDAEAPTAPTSQANANGKTRTTAGVDWDVSLNDGSYKTTPSLVSVIQELADSYDPSAIQILHDDDGSNTGSSNYQVSSTYDNNTAEAAKLDITHSAGAPSGNPWYYYAQQGAA